MLKDKTIFVSGGAGFIGSHLCERLVRANKVVVYDNEHRNALKDTELLNHPNLTFIKGDVLEQAALVKAMKGSDIVIHLAAIAGIDTVIKKAITTMKVNLLGTYNALEAALACKVRRFINLSSSEVYGPHVYRGTEESLTTQGPVGKLRWTYATSKIAAEHLVYCYFEEYNLSTTIIRPFNIYGPQQVGEGAIRKFILGAIKNEDIIVYGDGSQIRAWCYIDDFIDGVLLALESDKAIGEVFNLGDPKQTISILGLAEDVIRLAHSTSKILFRESSIPDVEVRVPSINKAKEILGFEPKISLEEGILRSLKWYQKMLGGPR